MRKTDGKRKTVQCFAGGGWCTHVEKLYHLDRKHHLANQNGPIALEIPSSASSLHGEQNLFKYLNHFMK
jgi:hypothetical protein